MKRLRRVGQVRATNRLTHLDGSGRARMVDVGAKDITVRTARAMARIKVRPVTVALLKKGSGPKGNALEISRVAGIHATKLTPFLIPLCHPVRVTHAAVSIDFAGGGAVTLTSEVTAEDRTGVEMEALTSVSVAALTLYDMIKAVDRGCVIEQICLLEKTGGRSGHWRRRSRGRV
jgi:cyclic pyranopterin phosphate synthase